MVNLLMNDENYDNAFVIIEKEDDFSVDSKKMQEEKKQYMEESKSQETSE